MTDLAAIIAPMLNQAYDMLKEQKKLVLTSTNVQRKQAAKNVARLNKIINNLLEIERNEQEKT